MPVVQLSITKKEETLTVKDIQNHKKICDAGSQTPREFKENIKSLLLRV